MVTLVSAVHATEVFAPLLIVEALLLVVAYVENAPIVSFNGMSHTMPALVELLLLQIVETTESFAETDAVPLLAPTLNTTNSAATFVISTCDRSNSIAALAAVVTSGPASFTRQLA